MSLNLTLQDEFGESGLRPDGHILISIACRFGSHKPTVISNLLQCYRVSTWGYNEIISF